LCGIGADIARRLLPRPTMIRDGTVEAALHNASAKTAELDRPNLNFFGTVWLRHCPLAHQDSTPR
jgi:hypothetical protein